MNILEFFSKKEITKRKKNRIRNKIRTLKKKQSRADKDTDGILVFEKIEKMREFVEAEAVLVYWATRSEVPTYDFIEKWSSQKTILLPTVKGKTMKMKRFISADNLITGEMKNKEPQTEDYDGKVDLAIIPGIAFDTQRNRMGRGKGYYDRFLAKKNVPNVYGVCFDFQILKKVPTEKTDMKMDKVISPNKFVN